MIVIIAGHYGVGKTNLTLNMAFDYARLGWDVTVADVDVVNPYFRSSDYREQLEAAGIRVIAPLFAGTSLDNPSLSAEIPAAIEWAGEDGVGKRVLMLDIGGDDVGATAIGRFSGTLERYPYHFIYVVNKYRNLTQTPTEALEVLFEVEKKSHLRATAIVNNSHLRDETTAGTVRTALDFGEACASEAGLPLSPPQYLSLSQMSSVSTQMVWQTQMRPRLPLTGWNVPFPAAGTLLMFRSPPRLKLRSLKTRKTTILCRSLYGHLGNKGGLSCHVLR